jgi:hypothetical protein
MGGIWAVSGGVEREVHSVGEGVERVVAGGVGIEDIVRPVRRNCTCEWKMDAESGALCRRFLHPLHPR